LRLCFAAKLPQRAVARSLGLSQGAVSGYLSRARAAGIIWPIPENLDNPRLEALLFPPPCRTPADQRPMPDWAWVHHELRRPDVTLALLWEEHHAGAADGFGYSWFCDLYRAWAGRLKLTMRQVHVAGEKLFVDFTGRTGAVIDAGTGEAIPRPDFCRRARRLQLHRCLSSGRPKAGPGGRYGAALRYGDCPSAALQAVRQRQDRGRRPGGRTLDPGAAAAPALLLIG
jgi:hypothetical protein